MGRARTQCTYHVEFMNLNSIRDAGPRWVLSDRLHGDTGKIKGFSVKDLVDNCYIMLINFKCN